MNTANEMARLRAENERLRKLIGDPPPGSHPDEMNPRGSTWHQEHQNWIAEVERLRAHARRSRLMDRLRAASEKLRADDLDALAEFAEARTTSAAAASAAESGGGNG